MGRVKGWLIGAGVALLTAFGGGAYVDHQYLPHHQALPAQTAEIAKGDYPDPQQYWRTVHTPRANGTQEYVTWVDQHCRNTTMLVAIYTLNNPKVVDAWVDLKTNHRTDVRVLLDLTESKAVESEKTQIERLKTAGIPYRIGHSPEGSAIMHNKYTACAPGWVQDGSWNYTTSADDQGNTLNFNIVPSPLRYQDFKEDWDYLWADFGEQEERRAKRKH